MPLFEVTSVAWIYIPPRIGTLELQKTPKEGNGHFRSVSGF
jgi:hypothetical protein